MNLKKIFLVIAGLGILLNSSAQTSKKVYRCKARHFGRDADRGGS